MKISVHNHENLKFSSKVRLKADASGLVDLTKSVPSCGAYQVPDLMAIYWKMNYQKGSDKRLLKQSQNKKGRKFVGSGPKMVSISCKKGHNFWCSS